MKKTILVLCVATSLVAHAKNLYVIKDNLNAAFPYTSWSTAAINIQDAVNAATAGDTVFVDNGVYDSGSTVTPGYAAENRVVITKNITVHGMSKTGVIISGEDLFSRVRCVYMTAGSLENITLKNGGTQNSGDNRYDQSGGGAYLVYEAQLTDCVITNCSAAKDGGGVYGGEIVDCSILGNTASSHGGGSFSGTLTNCIFSGNSATYGGGSAQGTLTDCSFSENLANYGGGSALGTLTDCTFSENLATSWGGGSYYGSLTYCVFSGNSASYGGGSSYGELTDCTFSGNSATNGGGGNYKGTLTECTLSENSASTGGGSDNGILTNCTLSNNSATDGGGNYGGTLTACLLTANSASHNGGGTSSGTLTRCTLSRNFASNQGGGTAGGNLTECSIMNNTSDTRGGGCYNSVLSRCIISENKADGSGGGIYGYSSGSSATNCIIIGNSAIWGGGSYGDVILHNCTIKGNRASNDGGGCHAGTLYNCIIVDNHADGNGNNLFTPSSIISSCSPDLTPGSQGITNAPNFADVLLHLRSDSPCIDSGVQQGPIGPDFDGLFRPLDGNADGFNYIDMGAHEYASAHVDTDADGLSDAEEVQTYGTDLSNPDTDGDGRTDGDEVAMGFSPTYDEAPAIAQGEDNVINNPADHDLYTSTSIQDLNMGHLMLQVSNNTMNLSLQIQQSATPGSNDWNNVGTPAQWSIPADADTDFFRVQAE
jgi:hypothetical protein